jgi:hypothetical protein
MLLELALGSNLTVMSTQFQHKEIHKGSWLAPDQMTLNQIDHVLITSKKKELIEDVRTMRGPNIDSDHYLLKTIVNQKLPKVYYKKNRDFTGRWDESNLKNPIKLQEYRRALYTKLSKQKQQQGVEQEWKQIKSAITEAANEVIQVKNRGMNGGMKIAS